MKKSKNFNTQDVNGLNTNENKNNGVITMNKKSKYSHFDSFSGSEVKAENSVDTNDNKNNNGDDVMKLLTKKQFKGLKKGEAFTEYLSVGELADAFRYKADKAEELFKDAKKDFVEAEKGLAKSKKETAEAKRETAEAKKRTMEAEKRTAEAEKRTMEVEKRNEELELQIAEGHGKADAGLDLVAKIQNDLDELVENRDEAFERYETLGARMGGKKNRANINTGTIRHYKNLISKCKKDIANGIDIAVNKATIIELEAEIRNLQRQVDAANDTFMEMKHNKTVVSQEITEMDNELNKRYKLQGLLGELGYI